jgi:hypothetical protein
MDNNPAKNVWSRMRVSANVRQKSHAEIKRTSSIGYGTYTQSPARGDGNVKFFGGEAAPRPGKKRTRR